MNFLTDKITKPFQFTVEWEGGHVWIMEENGSGVKYACDTASSVANIVERYIMDMQTSALFDEAMANEEVYFDSGVECNWEAD